MIEVTLQLEEVISDEEIEAKMAKELPDVTFSTKFKHGKKFIILEIEDET